MDETKTTSTETITNEDIEREFADAFGTDDILFGDDDGDETVTDTKVTAETDNGSKDTDDGVNTDDIRKAIIAAVNPAVSMRAMGTYMPSMDDIFITAVKSSQNAMG